jgi:hypothetical protein
MRTSWLAVVGSSLLSLGLLASCSSTTCDDKGTCASPGETEGGTEGGLDGGGDVVKPPADCDASAEPKDAPKCVVSGFGVFVDASGADTNDGRRESPLKTIGAALTKLAGKTRIYVCEGTYPEHVKLTTAVSLYGGFACGSWSYSGNKPKVAPSDAGYALEIADATAAVTIADVSFVAASAVDKGKSSIAAFVHKAGKVVFVRAALEAGNGKEGADGGPGATGTITAVSGSGALNASGYPASGTTAGTIKTCTCSSGGTSSGAGGGAPAGAGAPGMPSLGGVAPTDGIGGLGNTSCAAAEPNGTGNTGADAPNAGAATKITALGVLDATGWKPQAGATGTNGGPGQGGGGGGGRDGAGGGAGCGGCGGTGGTGGGGGGASVALLAVDSTIILRASTLLAKTAGAGGAGGAKGAGGSGGGGKAGGSAGTFDGCAGGDGGRGGDGGTGGGGAGGVAVAVLHKGTPPTNEASTLTPGTKGAKGTGGTPGTNDGAEGQQADTLVIQ